MFNLTLPVFIFGVLASSLYGAAFHLWKDGGLGRLILYLILSWIGFWLGHILCYILDWSFLDIGPLHFGAATAVSLIFLFAGHWLSQVNFKSE